MMTHAITSLRRGAVGALAFLALAQGAAAQPKRSGAAHDAGLRALAGEFFAWRARTQPCSGDDIPRIERPAGWAPDFSVASFAAVRSSLAKFNARLESLPARIWSRADSVDYLLLRSAIERVRWELDILRLPHRDPGFYVHQTLGSVYELLLVGSPMTEERISEILLRLRAIPKTVRDARMNLDAPVQPFARTALADLEGVTDRLTRMGSALANLASPGRRADLEQAVGDAARALEEYAAWLREGLPRMSTSFSPGRIPYVYYLRVIALNPLTPEEMLTMGRAEVDRAVTFETLERNRNSGLPEPRIFATIDDQIEQCRRDELAIRAFLEEKNLLTIPGWLRHYGNRATPPQVEALAHTGVPDDLTSESRLGEDAFAYIPPPAPGLSYFRKACALDPRPIIIHEGVPGHYFQMAISWAHENPVRRRYYDSGPNEGWAFYVEEMMLQAGLFDSDRPRTREIIYNFMRLRALRVEVDIRLALGELTLEEAGDYLARMVPMDRATAVDEAAFFAATPGQAITYQIGKNQIQKFLRDARAVLGEHFSLREFHDFVARNGNVPIALQRWEYLGLRDEIEGLWPSGRK
jgi:uncharacterized protein (DUF885 family)